jgi:hypothetical protein
MRRVAVALAVAGTATAVTAVTVYRRLARPWYERWGAEPEEEGRELPGDELIAAPTAGDTRGVTIAAPAAAIWPWLVQMGYGRAGWYSYDRLDMLGRSAASIVPEWQRLAVGDTVPAWPGGGFEVARIEPDHALVFVIDDTIVARQAAAARDTGATPPSGEMSAGLAASAAVMRTQPSRFRASWAFVLEPIDGQRTRLIERVRVDYPEIAAWNRVTGPLFGVGVFLMMRRQMLGIRERAELLIRQSPEEVSPVGVVADDQMRDGAVEPAPVEEPKPATADLPELVSV